MDWKGEVLGEYQTQVTLKVINQRGVLGLIAIAISDAKANINNISIQAPSKDTADIVVMISISGYKHYQTVSRMLKQLRQVIALTRLAEEPS
jgi:guanosine-3',5'-bis(diphosphate) 3'-pyrophosphohydrolase